MADGALAELGDAVLADDGDGLGRDRGSGFCGHGKSASRAEKKTPWPETGQGVQGYHVFASVAPTTLAKSACWKDATPGTGGVQGVAFDPAGSWG